MAVEKDPLHRVAEQSYRELANIGRGGVENASSSPLLVSWLSSISRNGYLLTSTACIEGLVSMKAANQHFPECDRSQCRNCRHWGCK
jgi:hypothetical protein